MDTDIRQKLNFDEGYQNLLLLAGEPEITPQFTAGLQAALNETQQAFDMAMTAEEFEAVRLHLPLLRQILEAQEAFLLNLREKVLIEMWPSEALEAGQEVTN